MILVFRKAKIELSLQRTLGKAAERLCFLIYLVHLLIKEIKV